MDESLFYSEVFVDAAEKRIVKANLPAGLTKSGTWTAELGADRSRDTSTRPAEAQHLLREGRGDKEPARAGLPPGLAGDGSAIFSKF